MSAERRLEELAFELPPAPQALASYVPEGAEAARRCALQILSALRAELGSLDRIRRVVKVTVWVASAPGFTDQPKVANGASDLFVEVFGDAGRHARAAVGAPELPLGAPVEVELVAEIEP